MSSLYLAAPFIGSAAMLVTKDQNMFYVSAGLMIVLAGIIDLHKYSYSSIDSEEAAKNPYLTDKIGSLDGYHNIRNCDRF